MDLENGKALVEASGLQIKSGSLTLVTDETGQFPYRVPISCINEPLRYVVKSSQEVVEEDKPEEETLEKIKIRNTKEEDKVFDLSNHMLVSELK